MDSVLLIQGKKDVIEYAGPIPEIGSIIDLDDGRRLKVLSVHHQSVMILKSESKARIIVRSTTIRTRWM